MLTLHTNLDPVRRSLLLALGLLVACGDSKGDTSDGETTNTPSSSSSGGASETGGTSASTTDEPTGTATGGGTGSTGVESTGGESSGGTTLATSGVSATEGSTSGSTGGETTAGEETSETVGPECKELMQNSDPPVPSGWVLCDGHLPQRAEQVTCEVPVSKKGCGIDDPMDGCDVDADCVDKPFGSCHEFDDIGFLGCGCVYGCETDADCDPGMVCRCSGSELGPFTTCTPSDCADDSECPGEACQFANSYGEDCPFEVNDGHCSTPADTCENDLQCGTTGCLFSLDTKAWACGNSICGRPFMVEERPVTAPAQQRDDWRALIAAPTVEPELAARLAAHWTEIGLYEHASVASFARFILQLLAVGAPAALVADAQRALADEVEHARVCFALASLYKGTGVGPGALVQAGDAGATGLAEITAAVIREACVGETLSALEVRESAARAEDAGLRRVLANIADDEQRHAELGWRFVQWALSQLDADGRARADEAFTSAIAGAELEAERLAGEVGAPELRAHGVIDAPLRAVVWRHGLRAIVAPSLRALAA